VRRVGVLVGVLCVTACSSDGSSGESDGATASVGVPPTVTFATTPPAGSSGATSATTVTATGATTGPPPASGGTPPATPAPNSPATAPLGDPAVALTVLGSFTEPLDIAWRSGDPTMFVVEQAGRIVPLRDGVVGDPVLDITGLVDAGGERGLLGLTFSPDGTLAYVDYTDNDGNTVIAEYPVAADGTMNPDAERVLLNIDQPYPNHNGGNVTIGPDGDLYIGMGDGGAAGDPERRALNVGQLLGKILRINPARSGDSQYTVPPDNPFVGVAGARPEIWSVGVRNPWRMAFDPATNDLWFADVGQGAWEEIDVARAADGAGRGQNFGWSAFEGTHRYNEDQSADGVTPPVYEYEHGDAGCSVSGGAVYRGATIPALVGWYVFGDYCSGNITGIRVEGATTVQSILFTNLPAVGAIRAGPDGELYAASLDGDVVRLVAA